MSMVPAYLPINKVELQVTGSIKKQGPNKSSTSIPSKSAGMMLALQSYEHQMEDEAKERKAHF
jgi:hypothetical protein